MTNDPDAEADNLLVTDDDVLLLRLKPLHAAFGLMHLHAFDSFRALSRGIFRARGRRQLILGIAMEVSAPHASNKWIAADAQGGPLGHALWLAGAIVLGFAVAFFGVSMMALTRDAFVLTHVVTSGIFLIGYAKWARLNMRMFVAHWRSGLFAAAAASTFSVAFVLSQPASVGPTGASLIWSIVWLGVAYGVVDALLLTVLPATAIWAILGARATRNVLAAISLGAASLLASAIVTAAYHLGFPEFRGPQLVQPIIGNAVITLAYVLSGNRSAPIVAHVALHLASVLHAYGTSVPLPPHYAS